MSLSSSLSGITFSGIGSGIDTASIVSRLLQVEAIPIQRLQQQQQTIQTRMSVMGELRSRLSSLSTSASSLNSSNTFNPIKASSSDSAAVGVSSTVGSVAGTYQIEVTQLAKAHKVSSAGQTDSTSALNLTGTFSVNGKGVTVEASDSLTKVAQKINSANAGVTASIINGGAGNAFITLTAKDTGESNAIALADLGTSNVLSSLGLTSGAASVRSPITDGAKGNAFASQTQIVSEMLKVEILPPNTVQISVNGQNIDINLSSDSLDAIASKINAANAGATASVVQETVNGSPAYRLQIVGDSGTPTFADSENVLTALGILQQGYGNQLVAAQDAEYSIDGVDLTSASNSVKDVLPGVTLSLNKTTDSAVTVTMSRDDSAVASRVKDFVAAYNNMVDFIRQASQFDGETFQSGPLFGDPVAGQVENTVATLLFNNVAGLTGDYKNLTTIGFDFDANGKLQLDESKLAAALQADPTAVSKLFKATGTTSNDSLVFISNSDKTIASGAGAYDVVITQAATKGSYRSATAQSQTSIVAETLTFSGALFGNSPTTFIIPSGSTLQDTVDKINSDSKLKDLVVATIDGGTLKIESKKFGSNGNFTVESDLAADTDNSGIGQGAPGTTVTGLDVAGTINGEAATGAGQFLTGNTGNAKTAGLQVQYTGTGTGLIGTVGLIKGVSSQMTDTMSLFLDSVNGLLSSGEKAMQAQIDQIDESITRLSERIKVREAELRYKFAKMDEAIASLQSQSSRLTQITSQLAASKAA